MLKEVAYSPDIVWISYGTEQYDPLKFKPIDYTDPGAVLNNKPWGGLWACPENGILSWHNWCKSENQFTDNLNKSFKFKLKPKAKIYVIDTEEDLVNISTSLRYGFMIGQGYYCIDFERLLREGYDGIYVTDNAVIKLRRTCGKNENVIGLKSWDVESLCVFNPDVIVPVTENKVTITESEVDNIIKTVLNEYLDKNLMGPLKNYLDASDKKYTWGDLSVKYEEEGEDSISTNMAFSNHKLFKNGWVLHFTNNPYSIIMNGFRGIVPEYIDKIWRTYGKQLIPRGPEGYAFAFDANGNISVNALRYGEYALMFRTSGLKVKNIGDSGQEQVIFNSRMANMKCCFLLKFDFKLDYYGDDSDIIRLQRVFIINPYTRKPVYIAKDIQKAVQWVEDNYQQYTGTNVFNNIGKLNQERYGKQNLIKQAIKYFQDIYNEKYVIDTNDIEGNFIIHITYEDDEENRTTFTLRKFKEYLNSIGINNVKFYLDADYVFRQQWIAKYGKEHGELKQIIITI